MDQNQTPTFEQLEQRLLMSAVPVDWRLAGNYSNVHDLVQYDSVAPSAYYAQPWGLIDVLDGYRAWVFDKGGQAVGVIDTNNSSLYFFSDFGADYGIYGDDPGTAKDEGATTGDQLRVLAQDLDTNYFFMSEFVNGRLLNEGFVPEGSLVDQNDIHVIALRIVNVKDHSLSLAP